METTDSAPVKMSHIPALVHPHLETIRFNTAGGLYVGASSLTGRYWKGSLWYFDEADKAPDVEKCHAGVDLAAGTADFQLLADDKVVLASDAGSLQVWQLGETKETFTQVFNEVGHDDLITSVSVNCDKTRVASASHDCRVKVWDLTEGIATHTYKGHYSIVHCAAFHPSQPDVFVSCSQDGTVLVWDLRKPHPATKLDISGLASSPTFVAWQPSQNMSVAIATENGGITLKNCASDSKKLSYCHTHAASVNKLVFHCQRSNWVASTSHDCTVAVTEFQEDGCAVIYQDERHRDFAPGLAWRPSSDTLYTCGWDKQVLSHNVKKQPNGHVINSDYDS